MVTKGDTKLGIWFYDAIEAGKPETDTFNLVSGKVVPVKAARFAVWKWRWNGAAWVRLRRETGPLLKPQATARLAEIQRRANNMDLSPSEKA